MDVGKANNNLKPYISSPIILIITGAILTLFVVGLWFILSQREKNFFKVSLDNNSRIITSYVEEELSDAVMAIDRLVARWKFENGMPKSEFENYASGLVKDFKILQAIEWVGENYIVKWVVPVQGNEEVINLDLKSVSRSFPQLKRAVSTKSNSMSTPIDLVQGGKGLIVYFPILNKDKFKGLIQAVIRIDKLLKSAISNIDPGAEYKYKIHVKIDGTAVYFGGDFVAPDEDELTATSTLNFMGHKFVFNLIPMQRYINKSNTYMPEIGVSIGIVFSTMLMYLIYLFQKMSLYAWHNKREATQDALTNIPTLRLALDRLRVALEVGRRKKNIVAVLFVDLDKFKLINDTYGHDGGDILLKEVANRITYAIRKVDTAARIGGDEFLVILPEIQNRDEAGLVAEKINTAIAQPIPIKNVNVVISASIGIALFPDHTDDPETLIKLADEAMYKTKRTKPGGYTFA